MSESSEKIIQFNEGKNRLLVSRLADIADKYNYQTIKTIETDSADQIVLQPLHETHTKGFISAPREICIEIAVAFRAENRDLAIWKTHDLIVDESENGYVLKFRKMPTSQKNESHSVVDMGNDRESWLLLSKIQPIFDAYNLHIRNLRFETGAYYFRVLDENQRQFDLIKLPELKENLGEMGLFIKESEFNSKKSDVSEYKIFTTEDLLNH